MSECNGDPDSSGKALVTGATGFIGSHLTEALVKADYEVTCLVRKTSNLRWIKHLPVSLAYGSLADKESLNQAVKDKQIIFHCAALLYAVNRSQCFQVNTRGTANLLAACKEAAPGLKRFVFISSQAAAGPSPDAQPISEDSVCRPVSCYGQSKFEAEQIVRQYSKYFSYTIIRPAAVFGPRDQELLGYFKLFNRGWSLQIGLKERHFNIIFAADLVRAILLAAQSSSAGRQTYFIAYPEQYSWQRVAQKLQQVLNRRARRLFVPIGLLYLVASLSNLWAKISREPVVINFDKAKELAQPYWLCSPRKATEELGFQPQTPIDEALKSTFLWYKNQGWL